MARLIKFPLYLKNEEQESGGAEGALRYGSAPWVL